MTSVKGVIYILTNPSFPDYIKIGYADDINSRLKQLNNSECTPYAFRVYATYEVPTRLSDLKIHAIIDKLNPSLRAIETVQGKGRIREFYAMSPEDAYSILSAIAEIHGCEDKLKRIPPNEEEIAEEETAEDIAEEKSGRLPPFAFSLCHIPFGATIEYCCRGDEKSGLTCTVVDDHTVEYLGKKWSLSGLATMLTQSKWGVAGPRYFKYNGEWLNVIRKKNSK